LEGAQLAGTVSGFVVSHGSCFRCEIRRFALDVQALLDELEACMLAIGLSVVPPPTLDLDSIDPSSLLPPVPALPSPLVAAHAPGAAASSPPLIADDESGGSLRSSFDQPAALQVADSGDSGADARHGAMHHRDDNTASQKRRRKSSGSRGGKARHVAKTPEDDDDFIVDDDDDIDEDEAEGSREPSSEADSDLPSIAASGSDLDSEPDDSDEEVVSSAEEEGGSEGGGRAARKRRKRGANGAKRGAAGAAIPGSKVRA